MAYRRGSGSSTGSTSAVSRMKYYDAEVGGNAIDLAGSYGYKKKPSRLADVAKAAAFAFWDGLEEKLVSERVC